MGGLLGEEPPRPRLLTQIGDLFIPDFLSRRKVPSQRLGPTAWLDGLRGCAALCVAFMHLTVYTHDGIETCYGSKFLHNDDHNISPAALPILRLPFTGGHFAVMLFFVISGYVVPRRLLQDLHEGRRQDFFDNLHSAMVRRPVRLYLPVFLSTLLIALSWHLFGMKSPSFAKQANLFLELRSWFLETSSFSFFFKYGWLFTYYNVHSWTIPVELRGSMFMFAYLLIVHNVRTKTRILMTLGMVLHMSLGASGAWFACFFGGMFLCDLELLAAGGGKDITFFWDRASKWLRANGTARVLFLHSVLIASLYLATQPNTEHMSRADTLGNCPGWKTLGALIPPSYFDADSQFRWFWLFWAAFLMVYAVRELAWLRGIFETRTSQYLGRHSFALYLVHGPMITSFSNYLFYLTGVKQAWRDEEKEQFGWLQNAWSDAPWWPLPAGGPAGLEPNYLFCAAVSIPVFLYVAEVGTRLFDTPSVKASRWVWQKWQTL